MAMRGGPNFDTKHSAFLRSFFDRDAIMKAVDKGVRKQLGWFGGYTRRVIRNSLKEKDGFSGPGEIPHVHTVYFRKHTGRQRKKLAAPKRSLLYKDSILYAYIHQPQAVIIGPFLFNSGNAANPVPETIEKGGWRIVKRGRRQLPVRSRYAARPHVLPGFLKALPKFRERLSGSITKG